MGTNGGKAMYQGQGMHNYVLKSGASQFHGTLINIFAMKTWTHARFFAPFAPVDRQNEFGGNIGGPIKKDKIFFFSNVSGYYYHTATAPLYLSLPTLAERGGDFSALPTTIYDPSTYGCAGAICSKDPFPNNQIPGSRISSVAKSFQSYLVAPTNGNLLNNYLSTLPKSLNVKNTTTKVDINQAAQNKGSVVWGVRAR